MAFRDYSHDIQQIRVALHHSTGSRASVMVGSGFSLNAQKRYVSARPFPTWASLAESLVKRLYPDDERERARALKNVGATSGALRLAQEFEAAFGRTVLLNHLREMLPDREHEPGTIHQDLLSLPWADVFTTNYDTLLERAAQPLRERRYEIVRCVSDLPLKRAPRIVKLHGTLPELNDCILTEEDYRTYPERFSPFVAEVQVAMVETHLCLVGFSGDDPNFLAWSGWVRDRMKNQTLPIYLWTFEEPTTFQSRMLEQRSVVPLPLQTITQKSDREEALRDFLRILRRPLSEAKPRWCLPRYMQNEVVKKESVPADKPSAEDWLRAAMEWRANRTSYPEWIIPHVKAISALWNDTDDWVSLVGQKGCTVAELPPPQSLFVLIEIVKRTQLATFPLYDEIAVSIIDTVIARFAEWRKHNDQAEVIFGADREAVLVELEQLDSGVLDLRLEQLRHARETGDSDRFESIFGEISRCLENVPPARRAFVEHFRTYQRAIWYVSSWDDQKLVDLLSSWDTSSSPLWALRRAGLLIESGESQFAEELLVAALKELRTIADEGASESWSIEAWITFELRFLTNAAKRVQSSDVATEPLPFTDLQGSLNWLRDRSCDPDELIEWLQVENAQEFKRAPDRTEQHGFETRRWSRSIGLVSTGEVERKQAAYRALRLIEEAGLPLRSGYTLLAASFAEKAIRLLAKYDASEVTGAVLRIRTKKMTQEWFSRKRIATLPIAEVKRLFFVADRCVRHLIERPDLLDHDAPMRERFAAAIELLSRAAMRMPNLELQGLVQLSLLLPLKLKVWERWWLAEDLNTLSKRAGEGIDTAFFVRIAPVILRSPIPGTLEFPIIPRQIVWVDPVCAFDGQPEPVEGQCPETSVLVDEMISSIASAATSSAMRSGLLTRVLTLGDLGFLAAGQLQSLSIALYERRDGEGFPTDTGRLDSLVLRLPAVIGIDEHQIFADKYVLKPWPNEPAKLSQYLKTVAMTGRGVRPQRKPLPRVIAWSDEELRVLTTRCCSIAATQIDDLFKSSTNRAKPNAIEEVFRQMSDWSERLFKQSVDVIDAVLIDREIVPNDDWQELISLVNRSLRIGLPVITLLPKLATFDSSFRNQLEIAVCSRLSCSGKKLGVGLRAVSYWVAQLKDTRVPRIPNWILSMFAGLIGRPYSRELIPIFDALADLARHLPVQQLKKVIADCEPDLAFWMRECSYEERHGLEDEVVDQRMQMELPDLRVALTSLSVAVRSRGVASQLLQHWLESVDVDTMPEMRKARAERSE